MAKPKFSLTAAPTFKATVPIPVAGSKPYDIEFTFKNYTKDAFKDLTEKWKSVEDHEAIMDIACGWDLDDPFNAESVEELTQNHAGSAGAIFAKYVAERIGAKTGN